MGGPLNAAIYPAGDVRRDPDPGGAPGCPPFNKDSVHDREGTIPFTSVCPGLHRLTPIGDSASDGAYDVVWWDPASLELDCAPNFGLRREELIAKMRRRP